MEAVKLLYNDTRIDSLFQDTLLAGSKLGICSPERYHGKNGEVKEIPEITLGLKVGYCLSKKISWPYGKFKGFRN